MLDTQKWKRVEAVSGRHIAWKMKALSFVWQAAPPLIGFSFVSLLAVHNSFAGDLYWDPNGSAAGTGGTGTWDVTTAVWRSSADGTTGPLVTWNNTAHDTAVFSGTAGTVTLTTPITIGGMQFASNGYSVTGNQLTLGDAETKLRVGNGTPAAAAMTATISSTINGDGQLVKSDAGILVLNGNNSYTGGTSIDGGTLRISSDSNLGNASGALNFNGGALNTTASLTSARMVTLTGAGTMTTNASTVLTLTGPIGGAGTLTKAGAGTLILTGNATYSGGTTISTGTLQLGNGGVTGSVTGNIVDNAALVFNRSDTVAYSGSVSGSGTLTQSGSGTLSLEGTNTYGGVTTVERGQLKLDAGGSITGTSAVILRNNGQLIVDGPATRLTTAGSAVSQVGSAGAGSLTIRNGGSASFGAFDMAYAANSSGTVLITDPGSQMSISGTSVLGRFGTATINVLNGGKLISAGTNPLVGGQLVTGNGNVLISGKGSEWKITQSLQLRRGTVTVSDNGHITAAGVTIGYVGAGLNNPDAALLVTGAGSLIETGSFSITNSAASGNKGVVTLADGAVIRIGSGILAMGAGNATLNIGAAEGSAAVHAGTLQANSVTMASANNRILFNHDDADYQFSAAISGAGYLDQNGPGVTVLSGANSYKGTTAVNAGSLYINGDQSLATGLSTVASGATLGGSGTIGGDVEVLGSLDPGDFATHAGQLTINGSLLLHPGARLLMELGESGTAGGPLNDVLVVNGDLTLDGSLDIRQSAGGNYGPGIYRIISYTGNLTDNGLTLGNVPVGSATVQTSIAQQVNLIAGGENFDFWDGSSAPRIDGVINGGDGLWQAQSGNDNWTEYSGHINASYNAAALAVFGGSAGTVVVDNSLGAVHVKGMQFATDSYVVTGDALTLTDPQTTIRVGDGTIAGVDMTATIRAQLRGNAQLVKTDAGTLLLAGDNSYTGGTRISGGTVRISSDENLGAASGGLIFDGGALNTTADIKTERSVVVASSGVLRIDSDTTLTLNGSISGAGSLSKQGAGTLELRGDNWGYSGHATIAGGELIVAEKLGGSLDIEANGILAGAGTVGSTTNAGIIVAGHDGQGTLTIDGNYSGTGGRLDFATVLGDDNSTTSRLDITGNSAGTTRVAISNRGGLGAQTVNGIKLINVGGQSEGIFTLNGDYMTKDGQPAIMTASAFAYTLQKGSGQTGSDPEGKGNDGNWYLVSQNTKAAVPVDPTGPATPTNPTAPRYSAAAPVYQSYHATLQALNQLPSLQQRVGDRHGAAAENGFVAPSQPLPAGRSTMGGVWGRIEGAHNRIQSAATAGDLNQNINTVILQAGVDGQLYENDHGLLIAGLTGQYGNAHSNIDNLTGDGSGTIDTQAWGLGANATFYGNSGFYLDAQAGANWYDSDLDVDAVNRTLASSNKGFGYALSLEAGQRFTLNENWSLTPQAQLMWSSVDFDSFTDSYGARISSHDGDNLNARLGLAANYQNSFIGSDGRRVDTAVYGIANLYQTLIGENRINYAGTGMASAYDKSFAGIGFGGTYAWADNKYALYGEGSINTSLNHFADSYTIKGNLGFKVKW
ncbi:adhesin BmaC autotransporter [Brucella sp. NBRC 12953]|uniref:autotransporter outer membrane beta-barrel domain-containing protein n=1 Tax=Brucella sp. NBRC 12953 TaxID=3075481 RepID=UPI0030B79C31